MRSSTPADVLAYARSHGWEEVLTGGGCTALSHEDAAEGWWWITTPDGGESPKSWGECALGRYEGREGEAIGFWRPETLQAAVEMVARQMAPAPAPWLVATWERVVDHEVPTTLVPVGDGKQRGAGPGKWTVESFHVQPRIGGTHQLYKRVDTVDSAGGLVGDWYICRFGLEGGR